MKKRQQRVLMILDSKNIQYEVIDITEPANEDQRDFMRDNCTSSTSNGDNNGDNFIYLCIYTQYIPNNIILMICSIQNATQLGTFIN